VSFRFDRRYPDAMRALAPCLAIAVLLLARAASADIPVDDFEDVSDWNGLDADTQNVKQGTAAGRWDDQVNQTSIKKTFASPLDVSKERHLQFWVWSGAANGAQIQLVLDSDNAGDPAGWDYYSTRLVADWTGWKLVVLPLADFDVSRSPLGFDHINYISMSAEGWGHTPLADTVLVLDDMLFGTGVIAGVRVEQGWQGADFVFHYTVALEDRLGTPRNLSLAVETPAGYSFLPAAPSASVALAANGKSDAAVTVTVPASKITPATRLQLERATLTVSEQGSVRDATTLSAAVPLEKRDHPRTLATAADFDRIAAWAAKDAWATAARDSIVSSAQGWPAPYLKKYAVAQWALPPEGGQWGLWYVCPKHGVKLVHTPPMTHTCPIDNEVLTGWPYDQVIYGWMHGDLADAARNLGLAWKLAGDAASAGLAAQILTAYADAYTSMPLHDVDGKLSASGARVLAQTLDESGWLVQIAWAYDLIADTLTDQQRTHIEQDLLRAAVAVIARNPAGMGNWQSWHNAGMGTAAFAIDDPVGIAQAMRSPTDGFAYQMKTSVSADGFWYEGSWGYHFYALDALIKLSEMAVRAGLDPYGEPSMRGMFEAPLRFAMPDGTLPPFNDSGATSLWSNHRYYEIAYQRFQEPVFASYLGKANRGLDALLWGAETLPSTTPAALQSALFPEAGYAVLRSGQGSAASYAALDFGPHGGWHGHYDKLGFVFFARGGLLGVDPGTQSYAAPTHTTWDKVTLAHNTVVVDESTQAEATGAIHKFVALPSLSAASADAGKAYETASLLRTMVMTPEYVVDRYHVKAADNASHKLDWIHHVPGERSTDLPLAAYSGVPSDHGYQHLKNLQAAETDNAWQMSFVQNPTAGPYGSTWADQTNIAAAFSYSNEQAATGSWSGKLDYDFSQAQGYGLYSTPKLDDIMEKPSALRVQVYGDGSGNKLAFRMYDQTDERFVYDAGVVDWSGWKAFDLPGVEGWEHYLGNDDGVFDVPAKTVAIGITSVSAAKATGALYVDDIRVVVPQAGEVLVADFELVTRGLRVWMAPEPGTTVVTGDGLGPDLTKPVPMVMARRNAKDSVFLSLLEHHGAAPAVTAFAPLASNAAAADEPVAFEVKAAEYSDRILALADGSGGADRTFGDASCDGVLCMIRKDATSVRRLVLAEGSHVKDGASSLVQSQAALPSLQVDWDAAGARLDLIASVALQTELRIWGPLVQKVFVGGADTPFSRDGDYVVLNLVPNVDAGTDASPPEGGTVEGGTQPEAAGGDDGGCGCRAPASEREPAWALILLLAGVARRRSRER
jgi:oligo-alginate lyase